MSQRKTKLTNNVRSLREEVLMSKAELARKAGVSALTIDRVEQGADCRLDTKRKIILALGRRLQEKDLVFPQLARSDSAYDPPRDAPPDGPQGSKTPRRDKRRKDG